MNIVATMYAGSDGKALRELSYKRHQRYAARCAATIEALTPEPGLTFSQLMLRKMEFVRRLLENGHRVLWIDGDVMIRNEAPDLFKIVPEGRFAAADEGSLCDEHQIYERCQHIVATCEEEGMPVPATYGRYFNCGVFLTSDRQQHLFAPRYTHSDHNWCEQSLVNARMFSTTDKPVSLPECFNRFVYWGPKPKRFEDCSYFLHYAGPASPQQRIIDMTIQHYRWGSP